MAAKKCPKGHGEMALTKVIKTTPFKGVDLQYETTLYVCKNCGLEAATIEQTGELQKTIADEYRKHKGWLTSEEIKNLRKEKGLTQKGLAEKLKIGIASIKRWETGAIQTPAMDEALRRQLQSDYTEDLYSGNRTFSTSRIKLVANKFEEILGKILLKEDDKMLFLAKYIWYADMQAFRIIGRSMTGAQYAALPYGPQLNNYKDLVDEIINADIINTKLLSPDEEKIISQICKHFPAERSVYDAAHREIVWQEKANGAPILYSDSFRLTEI
ncbi:MAG: DUF4065 domain-containing protein [Desulfobacterales bacterium]|nr:DUF4065 domain-containing protein [Desulfobacterales bacterium]